MSALEASVLSAAVKAILDKVSLGGLFGNERDFSDRVSRHISDTYAWSSYVRAFQSSDQEAISDNTIALTISLKPRKFLSLSADQAFASRNKTRKSEPQRISESDIIADPSNYVILGDPGAGKTTTMKRLIQSFFRDIKNSRFNYPILVRLREKTSNLPISVDLLNMFGYNVVVREFDSNQVIYSVGDIPALDYLCRLLDETLAVLFIDGLDEVNHSIRGTVYDEIRAIALGVTVAKIVVTCRSGEYREVIDGFEAVEIDELSSAQIKDIAGQRLGRSGRLLFLDELDRRGLTELANRPLFLLHLILIFSTQSYLPTRRVDIYRKYVAIMVDRWDRERGILRRSKYADFDPDRKIDFLACFSYHLLIDFGRRDFNTYIFQQVYSKICASFSLPIGDYRYVAEEIESHTGIIVEKSPEEYEFSHSVIQEYLAGYYLVRSPMPSIQRYAIRSFPGPLAISVALAANPSLWFAGLILDEKKYKYFDDYSLKSFIERAFKEEVDYPPNVALGLAFLKILSRREYMDTPRHIEEIVYNINGNRNVTLSIMSGLAYYTSEKLEDIEFHENFVTYELERPFENDYDLEASPRISVARYIVEIIRHAKPSVER